MPQVWKIPINSMRDDLKNDAALRDCARRYCFAERWVGIGWGVDGLDATNEPETYVKALGATEYFNNGISAHRALAERMQVNDLVWCRARGDIYWLGRVAGPWQFRNDGEFRELDLHQVRECIWREIGPGDSVPGRVKNAFAGPGSAISQIHAESALRLSAYIWRTVTGEAFPDFPLQNEPLTLRDVGHDDLEDLVALYLQATQGWYVVPSTVKRSTPLTEFVLRNSRGHRAYLQVKSGDTTVDTNVEVPPDVTRFFLFDLSEPQDEQLADRLERISVARLTGFMADNRMLLPRFLQQLLEAA